MLSRPWHSADSHPVRVGLDLGTSGLKAVALDESGAVVARASVAYATARPEAGAAEQSPSDWITAVGDAVAQLAAVVPASQWSGIGLSAMLPTLVCLDATGEPVGTAITWEDSRAEEQGDALRDSVGDLYERTGQWVDGRYLLPMWMRLRDVEPQRVATTRALAGAKDYVVAWLTGELVTDPSTAAGFGCYGLDEGAWLPDVLAAAGIDLALPRIAPSTDTLPLRDTAVQALGLPLGLPVAVGAADSVLGADGMGASAPGDIAYVAGSSTVILGVSDTRPVDAGHRFIVTPMSQPGVWGLEMDLMATGGAIRWLAELLGFASVDEAMAQARAVSDVDVPVVLPYVSPGEQGALWDPRLTGVVTGLHMGHSRGHVVRGLVDGIVLESMRCIEVLREYGCAGQQVRVAGGSALDPWFRQLVADAAGAQVLAPVDGDSDFSAIGAALLLGGPAGTQQRSVVEPAGPRHEWQQRLNALDSLRHAVFSGQHSLTAP